MKRFVKGLGLAGWVLLGHWAPALAGQEVPVGRVDVQLPGEGWEVYLLEDQGTTFSGSGYSVRQTVESKLMVHHDADRFVDAIVMARANVSGKGRFAGILYSDAKCKDSPQMFAEGDQGGTAAHSYQCLQVLRQSAPDVEARIPQSAREWLTKNGWILPPTMDLVFATQHANTGAFATVLVYLRPIATDPVVTRTQAIPKALPGGLVPALVHWGRELQEAVRDSVYSIRGKLPVPGLQFVDLSIGFPAPHLPKPATPAAQDPAPSLSDRG